MPTRNSISHSSECVGSAFVTTHWSLIFRAGEAEACANKEALEQLCRTYWDPLYMYLRRSGHSPHDAEDLIQGFFAHLLEKGFFQRAHPDKGRFRSFLLGALRRFVADEKDRARAQKRGGGLTLISLDAQQAEEHYQLEPVDRLDPEKIYERRYANALVQSAFEKLRRAYIKRGKEQTFLRLESYLSSGKEAGPYSQAATELDITEAAVKAEVFRMRESLSDLFRQEIAQTVGNIGEIEDEMQHLCAVLRG